MCNVVKTLLGVNCETKDILALKAVDTRGKNGDMIKLFMVQESKKKEIMEAYFKRIFIGGGVQGRTQGKVDTDFKNRSGR